MKRSFSSLLHFRCGVPFFPISSHPFLYLTTKKVDTHTFVSVYFHFTGAPSILGQVLDIAPAALVLLGLKEAELGMDLVVPLQHGAGLGVLDAIADGALQQGIHHDGVDA